MSGIIGAGSKSGVIGTDTGNDYGYIQFWDCSASFFAGASGNRVGLFTSSGDRFQEQEGDLVNFIEGTTVDDLLIKRRGIYTITFALTCHLLSAGDYERTIYAAINGFGTESTNGLAKASDQVEKLESATSYGSATANWTGLVPANSQINFYTSSSEDGNAYVNANTHASVTLIKEIP